MPPKDLKRQTSELPNISTDRAVGTAAADPNVIPAEDLAIVERLGMSLGSRLKRGRYGVVYEGHFTEAFSVNKLTEAATVSGKSPLLHYLFIRPELTKEGLSGNNDFAMQPGRKFALKFCDIELRKAYHIDDVEQRLQQELNFVRRFKHTSSTSVVRHYAIFATTPTRYYLLMELAEDNLQCLINAYVAANRVLPAKEVIAMYASLVATVRSLHQQKLTYGMMRTSNILVFGQTVKEVASSSAQPQSNGKMVFEKMVAEKVGEPVGKSTSTFSSIKSNSDKSTPFLLKIADFVASKDSTAKGVSADAFDEAVEEDLDDLYYVHSELFTLTKLDFAQFLAFRESLKILTDFGARRNSMNTLDKVLNMVAKFALEQKEPE